MSYHVKKTLVNIISSIVILILYITKSLPLIGTQTDLRVWAIMMLVHIGIGVVLTIILHILFHIFLSVGIAIHERDKGDKAIEKSIEIEMVEDEMTKLIDLKSLQVGYTIAGMGFGAGLICIALGYSAILAINIMFLAFFFGSLIEGIVSIFLNFKGVHNG